MARRRGRAPRSSTAADPGTRVAIAQNFAMDVSMLWKDLLGGFVIAGALAAVRCRMAPEKMLFLHGAPPAAQLVRQRNRRPRDRDSFPSCVRSATFRWPLSCGKRHLVRRRAGVPVRRPDRPAAARCIPAGYYGLRMMLYIFGVFFVTDGAVGHRDGRDVFRAAPRAAAQPPHRTTSRCSRSTTPSGSTLIFGALAIYLWRLDAAHPMDHGDQRRSRHARPRTSRRCRSRFAELKEETYSPNSGPG